MRLRVDVGVDAQRHARLHADRTRRGVDGVELGLRLDVEHQDAGASAARSPRRSCRRRRRRSSRIGAGAQRPEELAARDDVEAAALAREGAQHREVGVGLDGEADQVRNAGKRAVVRPVRLAERAQAVDVGDTGARHPSRERGDPVVARGARERFPLGGELVSPIVEDGSRHRDLLRRADAVGSGVPVGEGVGTGVAQVIVAAPEGAL